MFGKTSIKLQYIFVTKKIIYIYIYIEIIESSTLDTEFFYN